MTAIMVRIMITAGNDRARAFLGTSLAGGASKVIIVVSISVATHAAVPYQFVANVTLVLLAGNPS